MTTPVIDSDREIRELLGKICAQSRRNFEGALRALKLHVGQDLALYQLWQEEGLTQVQLSEKMGCEPPTVTNMVKKLEEYGFITRIPDKNDARVVRVYLTDQGRALKEPVMQIWQAQQKSLLNGLLPEERLLMRRLLQQMLGNIS
jgi:DNA-binding MarR family transcriptional regulator